ncbi:hypothetical protein [Rhodococcus sp. APC 3903]|uniref:hypothetical protein n=1 Tax=Rhodococcus sp. APC 3903 TaxID=3035193 RepID=UPI0025B4F023|nr:hypothetical protein [Rhodococcus sp. APC 3903]MDN3460894.1 hypothetical protein [Rhodococcus sp. APC 3903]
MTRTDLSAPARSAPPSLVLAAFVLLVFCTASAEYLVAGVLPSWPPTPRYPSRQRARP